jgi:hypothetical protein
VQTLGAGQRISVDLYHQRRSSGGALGKRCYRRRLRMPTHFPTGHDRAGPGVCPRSTRAKCLAVEHRPRRKDLGCGRSRLRARLGERAAERQRGVTHAEVRGGGRYPRRALAQASVAAV